MTVRLSKERASARGMHLTALTVNLVDAVNIFQSEVINKEVDPNELSNISFSALCDIVALHGEMVDAIENTVEELRSL